MRCRVRILRQGQLEETFVCSRLLTEAIPQHMGVQSVSQWKSLAVSGTGFTVSHFVSIEPSALYAARPANLPVLQVVPPRVPRISYLF